MVNLASKDALRTTINKFCLGDNLFDLVEAMRIGVGILEQEGFPMREFSQYKYKFKRYGKEKRLN